MTETHKSPDRCISDCCFGFLVAFRDLGIISVPAKFSVLNHGLVNILQLKTIMQRFVHLALPLAESSDRKTANTTMKPVGILTKTERFSSHIYRQMLLVGILCFLLLLKSSNLSFVMLSKSTNFTTNHKYFFCAFINQHI